MPGFAIQSVTVSRLKTLLFTLGPFLLPRLISYYRTVRTQSRTSQVPIRATPQHVRHALNILFVFAVLALISSLPTLYPENIFTVTSSRIQTPNDVLFTRLAALRPEGFTTDLDETLRPRLASLDARCLYLTYGPDTVAHCPFCTSEDARSYFYYALPTLLLPHLLHLLVLGLATSSAISGSEGNRWRTQAAIVGAVLALGECYIIGARDWKANARTVRAEDLDHFYWRMRTVRGLVLALVDAGFAGFLWATSTNRLFAVPPAAAERIEGVVKVLENVRGRLSAVGIVRNAVVRDEALRKKTDSYWKKEGEVMGEVMDEREVVEGVRAALESGRVSVQNLEEEARMYAEGIPVGFEGALTG